MAPKIFRPAACAMPIICRYPASICAAVTLVFGTEQPVFGVALNPKSLMPSSTMTSFTPGWDSTSRW